jgi:hypothetical protein
MLRFGAFALLIALALSFFTYSSWEDRLLGPDFRSPNMALGRTIEYPVKSTVAYVSLDQLDQINRSKLFMFVCFAGMILLAGADYLTANKATK